MTSGPDSRRLVQSLLTALNERRISDAVDLFAESFTFVDHGLRLRLMEKNRLTEYFEKSRELFPDSVVEAGLSFECGDRTVVEWKLAATNYIRFGASGVLLRDPVSLQGVSIVQARNGRITGWSEYYDAVTSRRSGVAAFFEEWKES